MPDGPARGYSAETLAYLAGFLDGEGTFTVYESGAVYSALISAASTDKAIIDWLLLEFGGCEYAPTAEGNRAQAYQWQIRDKELLIPLLEQLVPFLRIKQLQARLLLKYCLQYRTYPRGRQLSGEDVELRQAYCTLFSHLNSKGAGSEAKKREVVELLRTGEVGLP